MNNCSTYSFIPYSFLSAIPSMPSWNAIRNWPHKNGALISVRIVHSMRTAALSGSALARRNRTLPPRCTRWPVPPMFVLMWAAPAIWICCWWNDRIGRTWPIRRWTRTSTPMIMTHRMSRCHWLPPHPLQHSPALPPPPPPATRRSSASDSLKSQVSSVLKQLRVINEDRSVRTEAYPAFPALCLIAHARQGQFVCSSMSRNPHGSWRFLN